MICYQESLRFALLSFSVIFMLTGAALVTIGSIYHLSFTDLYPALPESYQHLQVIPKLTIAAGALNFLFSFVGCVGAFINHRLLLLTYAIILSAICTFQFSTVIFITVQDYNDISGNLNTSLSTVFKSESKDFILLLQSDLKCCGTDGPSFWGGDVNMPVPMSCCADDACSQIYQKGCHEGVVDFLVEAMRVIGVSLLVVDIAQVAGAVLAVLLAMGVTKRNQWIYREADFEDD